MPKKLTYEQVKNYIEEQETECLSKEYKNAREKLNLKCAKGHIFWMNYNNFKSGQRCPECYGNKKHTYENVKKHIEQARIKLLSKEYKNAHEKLEMQCLEGHVFWMSYSSFKSGQRCPECYGNKKHTYEQVKKYIEERGTECLSKEYKNAHEKLKLKCAKGHIYWMSYSNFQKGQRCPECSVNKKKLTYEQVKKYIEEQGDTLLSKEYRGTHEKLEIQCSEGHIYWMSFANFQRGQRCSKCSGKKKLTNQEIIETLQKYENIRENENEEIEVTCAYCGKWHTTKRQNIRDRIGYIEGNVNSESRLYCSRGCKDNCPIFYRMLYPKGYAPATSREVQPQLRQLVFERDNYTCQKCGWHKDELSVGLHCHHKFPLNEDPIQSADMDTCFTVCESCHKEIHMNTAGCGYGEMRCNE